jgi:ubiquinone/menaquinone biosynthesis C-methylase UbiE
MTHTNVKRRGSYGYDGPYLLPILGLLIAAAVVIGVLSETVWPFIGAVAIFACAGLDFYATRRGKFVVWGRVLDQLHLQGDKEILDLGCGRGAILLLAAQHLTTGHAVGIDLWRRQDQSGNSIQVAEQNARLEGVADRVELRTADMTDLPFEDESFDLVISNLAIHNVTRDKRYKAIEEAIRVLRPGGRLMIGDLWSTKRYVRELHRLDISDVSRRDLGWRMWFSGPWARTMLVSCTKSRGPSHE